MCYTSFSEVGMDTTKQLNDLLDYIHTSGTKPVSEVKYLYIERFSKVAPIYKLCKLFGVGSSSYYDWLKRRDLPDPDLVIRDAILRIRQEKENPCMGYKRITNELHQAGYRINHKKVYRIMKKFGLLSIIIHSRKSSILYKGVLPFQNRVNRNFNASRKNSVWCIDITKLDSFEGRQYLCVIIDLFDRSIVSHKIYQDQSTRLVKNTIQSALNKEILTHAPTLTLHSDQGKVFYAAALKNFLKDTPLRQSMGTKGTPAENSVIESFFANLKKERIYINLYKTNEDVALSVIDYIHFYNYRRPHSYNQDLTPYEKRCLSR